MNGLVAVTEGRQRRLSEALRRRHPCERTENGAGSDLQQHAVALNRCVFRLHANVDVLHCGRCLKCCSRARREIGKIDAVLREVICAKGDRGMIQKLTG